MKKTCIFSITKILIRTIVLGIVASASHFLYELSGKNIIIGMFNPVNESVWEHLKFMFFPFLIWWIVVYLINHKKCEATSGTWLVSAAVSLVSAPVAVILLFYTYTGAFGIESLAIDILLVYVCYFMSISIAGHMMRYLGTRRWPVWILISALVLIAVIAILFIVFTFYPPGLPIFHVFS